MSLCEFRKTTNSRSSIVFVWYNFNKTRKSTALDSNFKQKCDTSHQKFLFAVLFCQNLHGSRCFACRTTATSGALLTCARTSISGARVGGDARCPSPTCCAAAQNHVPRTSGAILRPATPACPVRLCSKTLQIHMNLLRSVVNTFRCNKCSFCVRVVPKETLLLVQNFPSHRFSVSSPCSLERGLEQLSLVEFRARRRGGRLHRVRGD